MYGGGGRNRTGVHGFAGRCITTLPPRRLDSTDKATLPRFTKTLRSFAKPVGAEKTAFPRENLERERSLELPTSTLARLRSTN